MRCITFYIVFYHKGILITQAYYDNTIKNKFDSKLF